MLLCVLERANRGSLQDAGSFKIIILGVTRSLQAYSAEMRIPENTCQISDFLTWIFFIISCVHPIYPRYI